MLRMPAMTLGETRGLAAMTAPMPITTSPRAVATHTAPCWDAVRKSREKANTETAITRAPASGTSKGAITRLRTSRLVSRSEEHTSELQSLMRNSYAVFCLKKKKISEKQQTPNKVHSKHTPNQK